MTVDMHGYQHALVKNGRLMLPMNVYGACSIFVTARQGQLFIIIMFTRLYNFVSAA